MRVSLDLVASLFQLSFAMIYSVVFNKGIFPIGFGVLTINIDKGQHRLVNLRLC